MTNNNQGQWIMRNNRPYLLRQSPIVVNPVPINNDQQYYTQLSQIVSNLQTSINNGCLIIEDKKPLMSQAISIITNIKDMNAKVYFLNVFHDLQNLFNTMPCSQSLLNQQSSILNQLRIDLYNAYNGGTCFGAGC